ncbi:MAG: hypothetical protein R2697_11770 [Ilumatobacteraceae bacterium]
MIVTSGRTSTPPIGVESGRSAVEPQRPAVGVDDVGRTVDAGAERDGTVDQLPSRLVGVAGIDRVRPHQVMEFVEHELVCGADLVRQPGLGRVGRVVERRRQFEHQAGWCVGGVAHDTERLGRIVECSRIDDDAPCVGPLGRRLVAEVDDHVAAELERPAPESGDDPVGIVDRADRTRRRSRARRGAAGASGTGAGSGGTSAGDGACC